MTSFEDILSLGKRKKSQGLRTSEGAGEPQECNLMSKIL
jgi:hypothetical protein